MDVKTVCLGMLTEGAASGYDLKKQFESSFAHFFTAGYGSIYPALSSLAEQGLVDCEEIPQDGKPDRKLYQITVEGRRYLHEALQNTTPCHKVRSEFLAMWAGQGVGLIKPQSAATLVRRLVSDAASLIARMAGAPHVEHQ